MKFFLPHKSQMHSISHLYCALVGKSTSLSFSLLLRFWLHLTTSGILVPQLGIKSVPPALGMQCLNHWTTRKIPKQSFDRTWGEKGPRETESNFLTKVQWDSTLSRPNGSLTLKHIVRTSLVSQWLRIPCQCREHRFDPWSETKSATTTEPVHSRAHALQLVSSSPLP